MNFSISREASALSYGGIQLDACCSGGTLTKSMHCVLILGINIFNGSGFFIQSQIKDTLTKKETNVMRCEFKFIII